jgi:ornithine cyclodeaminase
MLILSADDVRRALPMTAAIESQRRAFLALSSGQVDLPLRTPLNVPAEDAVTLIMPARVAEDMGTKIVSVFPRNPSRGLPTIHGLVILIDATTGQPAALMEAASLTALRTGAASGLATDLLANPDVRTAAILGVGTQAVTQLRAICTVRPIERVSLFSRTPERVADFITRMQSEVPAQLIPTGSPAEAVRDADVICTCTTSATPVFEGRDLRPGAHVNGIGSYTAEMQEVDTETVRRAGRVFVDSLTAALAEAGDVIIPMRQGLIGKADLIELGTVLAGRHPGRNSGASITFFKSVGVAAQDMTAAGEVLRLAREMGLGVEIEL